MKTVTILVVLLTLAPVGAALLTDPIQNDARSGGDAGDSDDTATPLWTPNGGSGQAAGRYSGVMVVLDDPRDVYSLYAPEQTSVALAVSVRGLQATCQVSDLSLGSVLVTISNPKGEVVALASSQGPCGAELKLGAPAEDEGGTWRIAFSYGRSPLPVAVPVFTNFDGSGVSPTADYELTLGCKPSC